MFAVEDLCRVLQVSRSGFYAWLNRPLSRRAREEFEVIRPAVREAFKDSRQTYGCVRISAILERVHCAGETPRSMTCTTFE